MSYNFEIIGIAPILNFFNYQQEVEVSTERSKAYLGSYQCTLDGFIESTKTIYRKPEWDWDEVVETMIQFWLKHEANIRHWKLESDNAENNNLVIARVANFEVMRTELEHLLES
jgi:hypothetical protein